MSESLDSMSPTLRTLRARIGAYSLHATRDGRETTAKAHAGCIRPCGRVRIETSEKSTRTTSSIRPIEPSERTRRSGPTVASGLAAG